MTEEILVHISAPTTRQNDTLYQSLANAYLEFEPARFYSDDLSQRNLGQITNPNTPTGETEKNATYVTTDSSILISSKDSYGSFPSHISYGNHGANSFSLAKDCSSPTSSRLARLEHIHKTWKENTTPVPSAAAAQHSKCLHLVPDHDGSGFIEDTQLAAQALQSQLQDSFSITSEDFLDNDSPRETATLNIVETGYRDDLLPKEGNGKVVASASSTSSEVFKRVGGHDRRVTNQIYNRSLHIPSNQACNRNVESVRDTQSVSQILDFSTLPLDGYPPAPQISLDCPGKLPSQITTHLAGIATQYSERFVPVQKTRTPDVDERGYWSLDCSNWQSMQQQDFWLSLRNEVMSGALGWTTTLHRDPNNTSSLGRIKLYTWGEVVEHMWLILWVCSKGKVAGSRSKWYDSDGFAVYKMP